MTPAAIRAVRTRLGLSQAAFGRTLAEALKRKTLIYQATVSRWERGKHPPPDWLPWALERLEQATGSR